MFCHVTEVVFVTHAPQMESVSSWSNRILCIWLCISFHMYGSNISLQFFSQTCSTVLPFRKCCRDRLTLALPTYCSMNDEISTPVALCLTSQVMNPTQRKSQTNSSQSLRKCVRFSEWQ